MNKMKIQDILTAQSLDTDYWEINDIIERVASDMGDDYLHIEGDINLHPYRVEIKGRRRYDGRRGAVVYVMYHEDQVISIGSFAGRELDDTSQVYVYDRALVQKLLAMVKTPDPAESDQFDPDSLVGVVYWEGSPIVLGESVHGIDDY